MADFFVDLLDGFTEPDFLRSVREKFHYADMQKEEFAIVAKEMLPLMRRDAFWEEGGYAIQTDKAQGRLDGTDDRTGGTDDRTYQSVLMSLGGGIDALQDRYSGQGLLSRSYMIEVLAGELLMRGYGAYNRYVAAHTDRHVARYHFLGSEEEFPLRMLPALLEKMGRRIVCNEAFCMIPKKSVAFVAELTQDQGVHCEGVCVGCRMPHCANRIEDDFPMRQQLARTADMPLPYGYSRILGRF